MGCRYLTSVEIPFYFGLYLGGLLCSSNLLVLKKKLVSAQMSPSHKSSVSCHHFSLSEFIFCCDFREKEINMRKHQTIKYPGVFKLVGVACGVMSTGLCGIAYVRYKERNKIRESDYYKIPMTILRSFAPAVDKLGHPIRERPLDVLFNVGISITPFTARLTVPLQGSLNSGILYSWASRDETYEGWRVERVDLEVQNEAQRLSVFRDNSKFPRAQMLDPRLMNKPKTEADDPLAYIDMQGNVKKQPVADDC